MGACTSKPKELDNHAALAEAPTSPNSDVQEPVVAQEESQNEAPLVDVSQPKDGETTSETKASDAEAVPQEAPQTVTVDTAEAAVAELLEAPPKEEETKPKENIKTEDSVSTEPTEAKTDEPLVATA